MVETSFIGIQSVHYSGQNISDKGLRKMYDPHNTHARAHRIIDNLGPDEIRRITDENRSTLGGDVKLLDLYSILTRYGVGDTEARATTWRYDNWLENGDFYFWDTLGLCSFIPWNILSRLYFQRPIFETKFDKEVGLVERFQAVWSGDCTPGSYTPANQFHVDHAGKAFTAYNHTINSSAGLMNFIELCNPKPAQFTIVTLPFHFPIYGKTMPHKAGVLSSGPEYTELVMDVGPIRLGAPQPEYTLDMAKKGIPWVLAGARVETSALIQAVSKTPTIDFSSMRGQQSRYDNNVTVFHKIQQNV